MNEQQHYYTELHSKGFEEGNGLKGFDSPCAHFSTPANVSTITFEEAKQEGIKFTGDQQVSHGWTGYTIGKTFVNDGHREADIMSPEWDYHRGTKIPTYKEL